MNTPYEFIATNSAQQSIPDNTVTGLGLDTIAAGGINIGNLTVITGQLILPFAGFYLINFSVGVTAAAAGIYNLFGTINVSTDEYGNDGVNAVSTQRVDMVSVIAKRFSAGDILKLNVKQVTGGAISIGNDTTNRAKLSVIKISD